MHNASLGTFATAPMCYIDALTREDIVMRIGFLIAGFMAALVFAAGAEEADTRQGRETITAQIEAFRADQNALAYSFAAPNITAIYPSVDQFMAMVSGGYRAVQKPQSYEFGRSRELGEGRIAQEVHLVGPDGKDYTAVYKLVRQADGSWKIAGVAMVPARARTI